MLELPVIQLVRKLKGWLVDARGAKIALKLMPGGRTKASCFSNFIYANES